MMDLLLMAAAVGGILFGAARWLSHLIDRKVAQHLKEKLGGHR